MVRCIDCGFCSWPSTPTGGAAVVEATAMCRHPRNKARASYVVGEADETLCAIMRSTGPCGPQAEWFYPREYPGGPKSMAATYDNRPNLPPGDR